ncbi:MAG: phospholipid carrier-dependent glycosyltransferase, partial [Microcystaceae cyanobacterium]
YLLSWPLLLVPIVGFLIYLGRKYYTSQKSKVKSQKSKLIPNSFTPSSIWTWLTVFLVGGYLLSSLNINKDARYILPLLPVLSLLLAVGLLSWRGRWQYAIRTGTITISILLMVLNLFPLGGSFLTQILSPHVQHYPYLGQSWPHEAVIAEIIKTSPYLRSTLGVLPSTPEINQHNFSYYGKRAKSQVAGRQVGVRKSEIEQDARSLDWFLTKTGDRGSVPGSQAAMVQRVEQSSDFQQQQHWPLPDRSTLKLYHRTIPATEVQPFSPSRTQVQLERVILPDKAPPGSLVPVTYQWSGAWEQLQSGIVLLTWQHEKSCRDMMAVSCPFQNSFWLHDHGIAMGALDPGHLTADQFSPTFQAIERTAMFPNRDAVPGKYRLSATYLNRETGETYPIIVPPVTLTLDPTAAATPAAELDLVTQLRRLAPDLAQGLKGLEPIFAQIARINQYDPLQDYLVQTDKALS